MKSKDIYKLEEAYCQITESSLRNPELSDTQAQQLVQHCKKIEQQIQKIKDRKSSSDYHNAYGPHDRLDDDNLLKNLEQQLRNLRKKYYGV